MPGTISRPLIDQVATKENSSISVVRRIDGLHIQIDSILFRVIGSLQTDNLHRLRVTLQISFADNPINFFCDCIDLYRSEERNEYADRAFAETGIKSSVIKTQLKRLIEVLNTLLSAGWDYDFFEFFGPNLFLTI